MGRDKCGKCGKCGEVGNASRVLSALAAAAAVRVHWAIARIGRSFWLRHIGGGGVGEVYSLNRERHKENNPRL